MSSEPMIKVTLESGCHGCGRRLVLWVFPGVPIEWRCTCLATTVVTVTVDPPDGGADLRSADDDTHTHT